MLDDIIEFSKVMKRLKELELIKYFEEANKLIQNYTGTLANHNDRVKLLVRRYHLAEQLTLYKNEVSK